MVFITEKDDGKNINALYGILFSRRMQMATVIMGLLKSLKYSESPRNKNALININRMIENCVKTKSLKIKKI